jgi:hypothetical protein
LNSFSSSATDSKLFLLLVEFFFFSSSRFKSNLQLFTGLPFFFKHVPNLPNNFNYTKKKLNSPHTHFALNLFIVSWWWAKCWWWWWWWMMVMMMKKLLANDPQEF